MKKILIAPFIILASLLFSNLSLATDSVILPDNEFHLSLANYVDVYEDRRGELVLANLLSPDYKNRFSPSHRDHLRFGYSDSAYWLRFTLHNSSGSQQNLILSLTSPNMDYLDLYTPINGEYLVQNTGALRPYDSRTLDNTSFIFTLDIPPQTSRTYFMRLQSRAPLNMGFDLYSPLSFAESEKQSQWYWGIAFGILLAALCYNFFSAFLHNDKAPLYLALFGLSIAFYQINWSGHIAGYLHGNADMQARLFNSSLFLGNFAFALFLKYALPMKLNQILKSTFLSFVMMLCLAGAAIALVTDTALMQFSSLLSSIVIGLSLLIYLIKAYNSEHSFVGILILAHSSVLLAQVLGLLTANNFLDYHFIAAWGGTFFTTLEFFILTFALMVRRNEFKAKHQQLTTTPPPARSNAEFLSKLSHELRTPMNGVLGMAELMEETPLGRQQQDYLATIQSSGRELLHLINDVSLYSKLDTGKIELENRSFDLNLFISNLADGFQQNATNRRLEFVIDSNLGERVLVIGDPQRLEHVLYNLMSNAFHYTEQGEVVLHILQQPGNKNRFQFRVSDTGTGISKEDQKRLFTSYDLLEPNSKQSFQGTGFGLALCKQLVELMGGDIAVESIPGKGTTFSFDITLFRQERAETISSDRNELEGLNMLIVDDNMTFRSVIERYAKSWDIKTDSTYSGKEALALLRTKANLNEPYDIIIIDHDMPIMNGLQLAHKIKDDPKISQNLLKVMLTGLNISSTSSAAQEAHIDTVLTKPMTKKMLKESLSILVRNQRESAGS